MAESVVYWNRLIHQPVLLAGQGRQAGRVVDFYYDPETLAITALRVLTSLQGGRVLLSSAIQAIEREGVIVANPNMLIEEANAGHVFELPLGEQLLGARVVNEQEQELGKVSQLLLGIYPPSALRISAVELGFSHPRRIAGHAVQRVVPGMLTVMDH